MWDLKTLVEKIVGTGPAERLRQAEWEKQVKQAESRLVQQAAQADFMPKSQSRGHYPPYGTASSSESSRESVTMRYGIPPGSVRPRLMPAASFDRLHTPQQSTAWLTARRAPLSSLPALSTEEDPDDSDSPAADSALSSPRSAKEVDPGSFSSRSSASGINISPPKGKGRSEDAESSPANSWWTPPYRLVSYSTLSDQDFDEPVSPFSEEPRTTYSHPDCDAPDFHVYVDPYDAPNEDERARLLLLMPFEVRRDVNYQHYKATGEVPAQPSREHDSARVRLERKFSTKPSTTITSDGCIVTKGFVIPGGTSDTSSGTSSPVRAMSSSSASSPPPERPPKPQRRVTWHESAIHRIDNDDLAFTRCMYRTASAPSALIRVRSSPRSKGKGKAVVVGSPARRGVQFNRRTRSETGPSMQRIPTIKIVAPEEAESAIASEEEDDDDSEETLRPQLKAIPPKVPLQRRPAPKKGILKKTSPVSS